MPIRVLEPTVAAQIAAGEVVERPASVIKELIENALDAGARTINVETRGGGLRELKVQDDGCGIPADEVELAFARHATSKLQTADDLWSIATLGFRGEALPSIASVAQVVCITRSAQEELGTELRIAGGDVQMRIPRGCSQGTTISVRHLFYNTPVRRDYLRSEATETSSISMVVQQYALAYPDVRFTLLLEDRLALQTSGNGNLRDVLIEMYGVDLARQMLPVEMLHGEGADAISIRGMISPPGLTRTSRNYLHLFVNRRAIQPRSILGYVLEEAYHTLLMKGRHPLVVLDVRVHPSMVDVNVHPTKSDVKFRHQSRVTGVLGRAVRDALLEGTDVQSWAERATDPESIPRRFEVRQIGLTADDAPATPPASAWGVGRRLWNVQYSRWDVGGSYQLPDLPDLPERPEPPELPEPPRHAAPAQEARHEEPAASEATVSGDDDVLSNTALPLPDADILSLAPEPSPPDDQDIIPHSPPTNKLPPLRIVGQVGLTYIIAESPDGMYLIDQHAVHERITYERLLRQRGKQEVESQELLLPQTVSIPPDAAELLLGNADMLHEWGFTVDAWGESMIRVRSVPTILPPDNLSATLLEIADHLSGRGGSTPEDWQDAMLITLACHTSVRAGQPLALEEMRQLLQQLEQCMNPHTCPHGRPTMILLTPGQLERQFGRQG